MKTFCVIFPGAQKWSLDNNPQAGTAVVDAIRRFEESGRRETIYSSNGPLGWVIGADTKESAAVYVAQETDGEKVTATTGSNASIQALVNVLRGHGYTCVKRGRQCP